MSRTRPTEGPTISLFPFLAVLLCTMGSLLVLLVLFSRSARQGAEAGMSADVAELELARDSLRWRVEQLAGVRDRTASDLEGARLQLAGVEDHARALTDEFQKLEKLLAQLEADGPQDAAGDLEALAAKLANARESLDKTRAEARSKPPAYAVVPYVGKHGTHRRPLYIECSLDGVFLQPEGVRLSPGDFEGPPGPGNPLACALRAAREHIARSPGASADPAAQPYPLLLVRPSGVMAYYAAREAIQSWGSDFGYQLIEEDWTLTFPPRDPALADVEKRAIEESRQRLAWLAEVRPAKAPRPAQQYRAATSRGGVVAEGGPSVLGDQSRFEWKNQAARGSGSDGFGGDTDGTGADGGGSGTGTGFGNGSGSGSGSGTGVGPGRPLAAGAATGGDDAVADGTPDTGDVILGGRTGGHGAGGGVSGGGGPGGTSQRAAGLAASGPSGAGPGPGGPGGPGGASGGNGRGAKGSKYGGGGGSDGGDESGGSGGGGGSVSVGMPLAAGQSAGGMSGSGSSIGSSIGSAAGATAASQAAGGEAMPGLMQRGGSGGGAGGGQQAAGSASSASASVSLAQARGRNWASLATQDRPIPLTRPIQIECDLNELRLLEDSGRRIRTRIPVDGDTSAAIDPLVKAIHARVGEWGLAGDRMYWKPQLVLSATPDGRSRRDDLQRLLADSGLDTRHNGHEDEIRNLPPVQRTSYLHEER